MNKPILITSARSKKTTFELTLVARPKPNPEVESGTTIETFQISISKDLNFTPHTEIYLGGLKFEVQKTRYEIFQGHCYNVVELEPIYKEYITQDELISLLLKFKEMCVEVENNMRKVG